MFLSKIVSVFLASLVLTGQVQLQNPGGSKLTSFIADIEYQTHRVLQNGQSLDRNEQGKYYLDSRGRLRYELGNKITISDPQQNVTWLLETETKVARKYDHSKLRDSRPATAQGKRVEMSFVQTPDSTTINKSSDQQGLPNRPDLRKKLLGKRVIEGVECEGHEVTSVIPINSKLGNKEPITAKSETWYSKELRISVLTVSENPLYGRSVMKLKNIRTGSEPDESLFRVPDGYRVVE
jgi:hypothetical protein